MIPDDIKLLATSVLRHRLTLTAADGSPATDLAADVVDHERRSQHLDAIHSNAGVLRHRYSPRTRAHSPREAHFLDLETEPTGEKGIGERALCRAGIEHEVQRRRVGDGDRYLLTFDNHNSVVGIRAFDRVRRASTQYVPVQPPDLRVSDEISVAWNVVWVVCESL